MNSLSVTDRLRRDHQLSSGLPFQPSHAPLGLCNVTVPPPHARPKVHHPSSVPGASWPGAAERALAPDRAGSRHPCSGLLSGTGSICIPGSAAVNGTLQWWGVGRGEAEAGRDLWQAGEGRGGGRTDATPAKGVRAPQLEEQGVGEGRPAGLSNAQSPAQAGAQARRSRGRVAQARDTGSSHSQSAGPLSYLEEQFQTETL